MRPLVAFLLVTLVILLSQTVYDPWSWERHIIKEIPAETYGMCQSKNTMAFFGPLIGLTFFAEAITLRVAWRTTDVPSDFRDAGTIMYSCWVHIQAWAVGVPMLASLGYSSVNASYFARIFLTWIFSVSSVAVIVCPKIWAALKNRQNPQRANRRERARLYGVYEPSTNHDDFSFSDSTGFTGFMSAGMRVRKNPWKLKTSQLHEGHKAAKEASLENVKETSEHSTDDMGEQPILHAAEHAQHDSINSVVQSHPCATPASPNRAKREFTDYIHGEQTKL